MPVLGDEKDESLHQDVADHVRLVFLLRSTPAKHFSIENVRSSPKKPSEKVRFCLPESISVFLLNFGSHEPFDHAELLY